MSYRKFIQSKSREVPSAGFKVDLDELNPNLFDWQRRIVAWALERGRAALFEECGMGKTIQQLVWAEQVFKRTGQPVVLHCPVGVRGQTKSEAAKFGIDCDVAVVNDATEVIDGINLVNYEKIHLFDLSVFAGVVLDESSILKNFAGKTRNQIIKGYCNTPYRLACTATPSPNDHMELGNHAEFLGVMLREDMLSKYFVHDSGDTAKWRLRGHAKDSFWSWVSNWAMCCSKPSDIGGSDDGFDLPELIVNRHQLEAGLEQGDGLLFELDSVNATTIHVSRRRTLQERCERSAEIANSKDCPVIVWCDTNDESKMLSSLIPDSIEVHGSQSESVKIAAFDAFESGRVRVIITKPKIAGFGMNWQHCNSQVFAGVNYSFEMYYQAVRRSWRFGQDRPVTVDIVIADDMNAVSSAVASKEADHRLMQSEMAAKMSAKQELSVDAPMKSRYKPSTKVSLPTFLGE